MANDDVDQFILAHLPSTYSSLHVRASEHFGCETDRKIDQRLQSLRKRGVIAFERVKGEGVVWSVVA